MNIGTLDEAQRQEWINKLLELDRSDNGWSIIKQWLENSEKMFIEKLKEPNTDRTPDGMIAYATKQMELNRDIVWVRDLINLPDKLLKELDPPKQEKRNDDVYDQLPES